MSIRSPVCAFLGHVDVGKTHLSDCLRNSSVHTRESGGITQQIGATFFSKKYLKQLMGTIKSDIKIPGMLLLDTPGHDCFENLRIKAFEISDVVVVVVDIIKGVEKQTVDVIENLKKFRIPYIVAANKVDAIHNWKTPKKTNNSLKESINVQTTIVKKDLDDKLNIIVQQFANQGVNVAPYYKNPDPQCFASIVPLSAKTCEGIPDMLLLLSKMCEKFMKKTLAVQEGQHGGYVMEIYKDPTQGTFLNVILTDGNIEVNDIAMFCGDKKIVDHIVKEIYLPEDAHEMKGKTKYKSVNSVKSAAGVMLKIKNPEGILSGTPFKIIKRDSKRKDLENVLEQRRNTYIEEHLIKDYDDKGVLLVCPYYGPVESAYTVCKENSIPVFGINIGFPKKMDFIKYASSTKEDDADGKLYESVFRTALFYQCEPTKAVLELAESYNITIISDNIIYKLIEKYKDHQETVYENIRKKYPNIVKNFRLNILDKYIFKTKNPIIMGVRVESGILNRCNVATESGVVLGKIVSIQKDKKDRDDAKAQEEVCIRIDPLDDHDRKPEFGRDFTVEDTIVQHLDSAEIEAKKRFPAVFD